MPTNTDPGSFDLDGWLAGAVTPETTVLITRDPYAARRLLALEDERERLLNDEAKAKAAGKPTGRRAGEAESPRIAEIQEQIDRTIAESSSSFVTVKVRSIGPVRTTQINDKHGRHGVVVNLAHLLAAAAAIIPPGADVNDPSREVRLTGEQWLGLLEATGNGQFLRLKNALDDVSGSVVTPDFFEQLSSQVPRPQDDGETTPEGSSES